MQNTEYIGKLLFAKVAGGITEKEFKDEFEKTAAPWSQLWKSVLPKGTQLAQGTGSWANNMANAWNNTKGFMNRANLLGKVGWHWAKNNPAGAAAIGAGLYAGNRLLSGGGGGYGYR